MKSWLQAWKMRHFVVCEISEECSYLNLDGMKGDGFYFYRIFEKKGGIQLGFIKNKASIYLFYWESWKATIFMVKELGNISEY